MASCTDVDVNQLIASLAGPSLVLPDYGDPAGPPTFEGFTYDLEVGWAIKIFYQNTPYHFEWFYVGESMKIVKTFGQRGSATFKIRDHNEDRQIIPFVPVNEQWIEIWNIDETRLYFAGRIRDPDPKYIAERADLTDAAEYTITCTDLYHELERKNVREVYVGRRLGFIMRDVVMRYTGLDGSDIDPMLGFVVDTFPINKKKPAQVLQYICDLLGLTYWIEPLTRKLKVATKDSADAKIATTFTDSNVYDTFDNETFSLRMQVDQLQNAIELEFTERYGAGTVNVGEGSDIVAGHGLVPQTEWDDLPAGLQFKLLNSDSVYTVEKNNSSGLTQELRLSSPFKEADAEDQPYELRGNRRSIYLTDEGSIGQARAIRGDDGIFEYLVSEDENAFTVAEAFRFAQALLILSRPLPKGGGVTSNDVFTEAIEPGQVIPFNLPQKRQFVGGVALQQLTLTDGGGLVVIDGALHAKQKIEMDWTATLTSKQMQFRKALQDLRKVRISIDANDFYIRVQLREMMVLIDCIHPIEPVQVLDDLEIEDEITVRDIQDLPLYYLDLDFFLGPWDYSFIND